MRNLITDVPGLNVGNAEDLSARTGVTVILPDRAARAAVDVRGGGPGTRETEALDPANLVGLVHAVVLAGGSVYGLGAADAVAAALGARGIGFRVVPPPVPPSPIVPAAILFDLANGGDKAWGETPPYPALARAALDAAAADFALGSVGAGTGATAGALKGGLGSASTRCGAWTVGALIAANPVGSVLIPGTDAFWAWPLEVNGEFGGRRPPPDAHAGGFPVDTKLSAALKAGASTVVGAVATDAPLTRGQLKRLAIMAHDGLARAVRPAHTPFDGDTIFALSTAMEGGAPGPAPGVSDADLVILGNAAADTTARALTRGVWEATALGPFPGSAPALRDVGNNR